MKARKKEPRSPLSLMTTVIMIVIIFLIWRPALFGEKPGSSPVRIPAREFVPVASNKALTDKESRRIVVTDFHAAKLNNDRSLHISLPPGYYDGTDRRYPVLYVIDGKSVFEASEGSKESLNLHEKTDALISEGKMEEIIIVGIDSAGENRLAEYAHWDGFDEQGQPVPAMGELYEDFILSDVKPFIDKNLRTLPDREHTALTGRSLGGLCAFNIAFRHPEVFSRLAVQSPYLGWGGGRLYEMLDGGPYGEKLPLKIWIDAGSGEGEFTRMAAEGIRLLIDNGYDYGSELAAYEAPEGDHSEKYWSERMETVLLYFYGDIGKPESVTLHTDGPLSLSDPAGRHINAVATFSSGFVMTDLSGSYTVKDPALLKVHENGVLEPLGEGRTEVTYTAAGGLTATTEITIVK